MRHAEPPPYNRGQSFPVSPAPDTEKLRPYDAEFVECAGCRPHERRILRKHTPLFLSVSINIL